MRSLTGAVQPLVMQILPRRLKRAICMFTIYKLIMAKVTGNSISYSKLLVETNLATLGSEQEAARVATFGTWLFGTSPAITFLCNKQTCETSVSAIIAIFPPGLRYGKLGEIKSDIRLILDIARRDSIV